MSCQRLRVFTIVILPVSTYLLLQPQHSTPTIHRMTIKMNRPILRPTDKPTISDSPWSSIDVVMFTGDIVMVTGDVVMVTGCFVDIVIVTGVDVVDGGTVGCSGHIKSGFNSNVDRRNVWLLSNG